MRVMCAAAALSALIEEKETVHRYESWKMQNKDRGQDSSGVGICDGAGCTRFLDARISL